MRLSISGSWDWAPRWVPWEPNANHSFQNPAKFKWSGFRLPLSGAGNCCPVEISFSVLQNTQMGKTDTRNLDDPMILCLGQFPQCWCAHHMLHLPRWFPHIKSIYKGAGEASEWLQRTWASHRRTRALRTRSWATANILERGNNTKRTRKIRPWRWTRKSGEIWRLPTTWFQGKGAR